MEAETTTSSDPISKKGNYLILPTYSAPYQKQLNWWKNKLTQAGLEEGNWKALKQKLEAVTVYIVPDSRLFTDHVVPPNTALYGQKETFGDYFKTGPDQYAIVARSSKGVRRALGVCIKEVLSPSHYDQPVQLRAPSSLKTGLVFMLSGALAMAFAPPLGLGLIAVGAGTSGVGAAIEHGMEFNDLALELEKKKGPEQLDVLKSFNYKPYLV